MNKKMHFCNLYLKKDIASSCSSISRLAISKTKQKQNPKKKKKPADF